MPLLEIACFNTTSALLAHSAGANRIELCTNQSLGGTTPPLSDFHTLKPQVTIPVNAMIRPRGGNFTYSSSETQTMVSSLEEFHEAGADGFVFGVLKDRKVDSEMCNQFLAKAKGRPCTFHRAFDEIAEDDMLEQLEVLIECGFNSVLTSGGKKNAVEGTEILRKLVEAARGRIDIIVGGGVRSENLRALMSGIGASTFHSSAVVDGGEVASRGEVEALRSIVLE